MTPLQQSGRCRWYQFTLRRLLMFFVIIVVGLVAWRTHVEPYRHERQVMKLIEELGGRYSTETRGPAWLTKVLGADHFQVVTLADLADCDEPLRYLPAIRRCPWLEVLVIGSDAVGDEDIVTLRHLGSLKGLVLDSTRVTDVGVKAIQDAIPELTIRKSQRRAIAAISDERLMAFVETRHGHCPTVLQKFGVEGHFDEAVNVQIGNSITPLEMTDADPPLRSLVDLETFHLHRRFSPSVAITPAGLANLSAARNLRRLWIEGVPAFQSVDWLQRAPLEEAFFSGSGLTDDGLAGLPLDQLACLDIGGTKVTEAGVRLLSRCKNLWQLRLDELPLTDKGLEVVTQLPKLKQLYLHDTQVTDQGLRHLANFRGLVCLGLSGTQTSNAGLSQLKALTDLRELQLNPRLVDATGLRHLKAMQKLDFLALSDLGGKSRIDDAAVIEIVKLKGLQFLGLDGARITDAGLARLGSELPNLARLELHETKLSDEAIAAFRKHYPEVTLHTGAFWSRPTTPE